MRSFARHSTHAAILRKAQRMVFTGSECDPVDLLAKAREGDPAALGTLLDAYRHYLSLLARTQIGRRLQGKADPSDLVQEVCLEAHRHIEEFRGTTTAEFTAWIRVILAGLVANHVRRYLGAQCRDARLEQSLYVELNNTSGALDRALAAAVSTPSEQVARKEAGVQLAGALEGLSEDYRQVIILRHLEALPFAQVAERMGKTVDSVEKLWVRALGKLRQALEEE